MYPNSTSVVCRSKGRSCFNPSLLSSNVFNNFYQPTTSFVESEDVLETRTSPDIYSMPPDASSESGDLGRSPSRSSNTQAPKRGCGRSRGMNAGRYRVRGNTRHGFSIHRGIGGEGPNLIAKDAFSFAVRRCIVNIPRKLFSPLLFYIPRLQFPPCVLNCHCLIGDNGDRNKGGDPRGDSSEPFIQSW